MTEHPLRVRCTNRTTGLRMTLLVHLPPEVADALATLANYLYDQAVADGVSMSSGEYLGRELRALDGELSYIERRFQGLVEELEPPDEAFREIVAMLGEVRHHLSEVAVDE